MEDKIFEWCSSHYPLITGIVVLIAVTIFITWRISKAYNHWAQKIKENENHCSRIDQQIVPKLSEIDSSIRTINTTMSGLMIYLKGKDKGFDSNLFVSRSPIRLTELGHRVLDAIGGKVYVDSNKDELIRRMNEIGISTAFDSQQQAPNVILERFTHDSFKGIKDYMFNNPFYKENGDNNSEISVALDESTVAKLMGIYLRDVYLASRPDLNVEDIP